jgi:hypothetical protein
MTEREAEILRAIWAKSPPDTGADVGWLRPIEFGGTSGSHHSKTASRMVEKGWLEQRRSFQLVPGARWEWRITAKGRQALHNRSMLTLHTREN